MQRLAMRWTILGMVGMMMVLGLLPSVSMQAQQPIFPTPTPLPLESDGANLEGWAAIYYPTTEFDEGLWLATFAGDLIIDFGLQPPINPFTEQPLEGIPADGFAARYSSNPPFDTGIYEFTIVADGGARMTVNDNIIIDEIDNRGLATFSGIAFVGSGPASLIVDYVDYSGPAILELTWEEVSDQVLGLGDTIEGGVGDPLVPPTEATARVSGSVTGLALRSGPYLGASLVAILRPGVDYTVIAQNNTEGNFTWYKVVVNEAGQTGWASGRFLDVNLGNVDRTDCAVPPSGGIGIAQTFIPNFSDAEVARSCFSSVAGVLNSGIGDGLSVEQITNVVLSCGAFGLNDLTPLRTVVNFVDTAKLVFEIYGVCGGGRCSLTNAIALEVASVILPSYRGTALQAVVCFNALAELLDGQLGFGAIDTLIVACSPLIISNEPSATNLLLLSFINQVASLICETTSEPTITLPEETTVFADLTTLPNTGVRVAVRSTMNLRVRPSTRTAMVGSIPWGDEAELLARTVQDGQDHWYFVRYEGFIGWIDASFANVNGNITSVPIY